MQGHRIHEQVRPGLRQGANVCDDDMAEGVVSLNRHDTAIDDHVIPVVRGVTRANRGVRGKLDGSRKRYPHKRRTESKHRQTKPICIVKHEPLPVKALQPRQDYSHLIHAQVGQRIADACVWPEETTALAATLLAVGPSHATASPPCTVDVIQPEQRGPADCVYSITYQLMPSAGTVRAKSTV